MLVGLHLWVCPLMFSNLSVVLMDFVTTLWSFSTDHCALTPHILYSPHCPGSHTNAPGALLFDYKWVQGFCEYPQGMKPGKYWVWYCLRQPMGGFSDWWAVNASPSVNQGSPAAATMGIPPTSHGSHSQAEQPWEPHCPWHQAAPTLFPIKIIIGGEAVGMPLPICCRHPLS